MMVIFVSQCEKKALKRTRSVLDAFANRIGDNTWQTVITQDGLNAVRKSLRKTASKNTAVSCHYLRSRSRSDLLWVVGKKEKFNHQGIVPVNRTGENKMNNQWENNWHYLPLIRIATALAALFHDWGKATVCFQNKLKERGKEADPLRHEWISCLLFHAFVKSQYNDSNEEENDDKKWLDSLSKGFFDEKTLQNTLSFCEDTSRKQGNTKQTRAKRNQNKHNDLCNDNVDNNFQGIEYPLKGLPPLARTVSWLILTHHRLPLPEKYDKEYPLSDYKELFEKLNFNFGYKNSESQENGFQKKLRKVSIKDCLTFKKGLMSNSVPWVREVKKWSSKALKQLYRSDLDFQSLSPIGKPENSNTISITSLDSSTGHGKTDKSGPFGSMDNIFENGLWRLILFHSRLSLMLGDHSYSSEKADEKWKSPVELFANTKKKESDQKRTLNQKLDEHLVNVSKRALDVVNCLPRFENEFPIIDDIRAFRKKSSGEFAWQDEAVYEIDQWRKNNDYENSDNQFGFFAVNMASTGKGKTFANAKIMQALSKNKEGLRYTLALGLRTLTLQTGDEYKKRLKLTDENDLAVVIGSRNVEELHRQKKEVDNKASKEEIRDRERTWQSEAEISGSESREELFTEELKPYDKSDRTHFEQWDQTDCDSDYECDIPKTNLKTLLKTDKSRKLLYSPILVCTIDHIMGATETKRGGRYILPSLRLMSSDLVIDEIDDFDVNDLKAIGRLIHLVGMLGRKVMISSATIPPDLAKGFFRSYHEGWLLFAKSRKVSSNLGCAWVDEFKTNVEKVSRDCHKSSFDSLHDEFVECRVKKLKKETVRRKAEIISLETVSGDKDLRNSSRAENSTDFCDKNEESFKDKEHYFESIKKAVVNLHKRHFFEDKISGKKVSFGVVRMANIKPCVDLTKYFLDCKWPDNVEIKTMAYHSQQVLLMRNEQEKHLDEVLKRKESDRIFKNTLIKRQLEETSTENIIYILVATPVEEVGRDHDFDWAVVEPSSYRSIIQLAGRVLRHRKVSPREPNIALMQYNLKGHLQKNSEDKKPVFCHPGYETCDNQLKTHDLKELVDEESLKYSVDAIPRIQCNEKLGQNKASVDQMQFSSLVNLEHHVIQQSLNSPDKKGAGHLAGWFDGYWWLTGLPQKLYRFRNSKLSENIYLVPKDGYPKSYTFKVKCTSGYWDLIEEEYGIEHDDSWEDDKKRLWLNRDYSKLLDDIAKKQDLPLDEAAKRYGELSFPRYNYNGSNNKYGYSPQFGLVAKKQK